MSAKDGLTFEEYKKVHRNEADYRYRHETFMSSLDYDTLSDVEKQRRVDMNESGQRQAETFADGLHGFEYYKTAGTGTTELDAVLSRYQAIPKERWAPALATTTVEADMAETFKRLRESAPPKFMNAHLTAAQKESLSSKDKKKLKHQLKDYKIMREKWEASPAGQTWKNEIARLKEMETRSREADKRTAEYDSFSREVKVSAPMVRPFPGANFDVRMAGKINLDRDIAKYAGNGKGELRDSDFTRPGVEGALRIFNERYSEGYLPGSYNEAVGIPKYENGQRKGDSFSVRSLTVNRFVLSIMHSLGEGLSKDDMIVLFDKLMAPKKLSIQGNPAEEAKAAREQREALYQVKELFYRHLKRLQATYGTMLTQLHPDDLCRLGPEGIENHFSIVQDLHGFIEDCSDMFDFDTSEEDKEFKRLEEYYTTAYDPVTSYLNALSMRETDASNVEDQIAGQLSFVGSLYALGEAKAEGIGGPHLSPAEEANYLSKIKTRKVPKGSPPFHTFGKFAG